jgi:3-oxoacyl-[acyl-carrier protein] reductase
MKRKKWGRIVNISSVLGKISKEYRGSYSTSKFALDGMTSALAAEVARYGILANCVAPGFIDTQLTRTVLGEKGMAEMTSKIPIGRLGKPEEIAAFIVWLASPDNTYISGQNIAIDGGFTRV